MSDSLLRSHDLRVCPCGAVVLSGRYHYCSQTCRMRAHRQRIALRRKPRAPVVRPPDTAVPIGLMERRRIEAVMARWEAYHRATRAYRIADGWDGYQVRFEK